MTPADPINCYLVTFNTGVYDVRHRKRILDNQIGRHEPPRPGYFLPGRLSEDIRKLLPRSCGARDRRWNKMVEELTPNGGDGTEANMS